MALSAGMTSGIVNGFGLCEVNGRVYELLFSAVQNVQRHCCSVAVKIKLARWHCEKNCLSKVNIW